MPQKEAYTVKQFAQQASVSESSVYRWIETGKIESFEKRRGFGKTVLIPKSELNKLPK